MPALHVCPLLQAVPHAPQLSALLVRSTHAPEQAVSMVGAVAHVAAHAPSEHTCPAAQAVPQLPQFAGSEFVSTQPMLPAHETRPAVQVQAPDWQVWLRVHACPHMPQLALSLCGSTHAPLHSIEPVVQAAAPPLPELLMDPPVLVSFPEPPAPPVPLDGAA